MAKSEERREEKSEQKDKGRWKRRGKEGRGGERGRVGSFNIPFPFYLFVANSNIDERTPLAEIEI